MDSSASVIEGPSPVSKKYFSSNSVEGDVKNTIIPISKVLFSFKSRDMVAG